MATINQRPLVMQSAQNNPYTAQQYALDTARAGRYDEVSKEMLKRAGDPLQGQVVDGIYVAPSWTQGLAKVAEAYAGRKGQDYAEKQRAEFGQKYLTSQQEGLRAISEAMSGRDYPLAGNLAATYLGADSPAYKQITEALIKAQTPDYMNVNGQIIRTMGDSVEPVGDFRTKYEDPMAGPRGSLIQRSDTNQYGQVVGPVSAGTMINNLLPGPERFGQTAASEFVKLYAADVNNARSVPDRLATFKRMYEVSDSIRYSPFNEIESKLREYANSVGVKTPDRLDIGTSEGRQLVAGLLADYLTGGNSRSLTDRDLQKLEDALPSLGTNPDAFKNAIVNGVKSLEQEYAKGAEASQLLQQGNTGIPLPQLAPFEASWAQRPATAVPEGLDYGQFAPEDVKFTAQKYGITEAAALEKLKGASGAD
jgi:hypothetical protein